MTRGARLLTEEGRALARLDHPHIAAVHEMGVEHETPYLAVEFVSGQNLSQERPRRNWSPAAIARLMAEIAEALEAAHQVGVVHRDLKPQNILLTADGAPKVIDFGLARLSSGWDDAPEATGVQGTVAYMSPEQASGDRAVGPSADLLACAACCIFC
ncbi:MAG: serine/threonine-protein kinase [Arachnia sp.]